MNRAAFLLQVSQNLPGPVRTTVIQDDHLIAKPDGVADECLDDVLLAPDMTNGDDTHDLEGRRLKNRTLTIVKGRCVRFEFSLRCRRRGDCDEIDRMPGGCGVAYICGQANSSGLHCCAFDAKPFLACVGPCCSVSGMGQTFSRPVCQRIARVFRGGGLFLSGFLRLASPIFFPSKDSVGLSRLSGPAS